MVTVMRPMLKAEPLTAQQGGLGLQYASAQYAANQTRNTGLNPSLFDNCTGFFYVHYTTHKTNSILPPSEERIIVVKFRFSTSGLNPPRPGS